MKHGTEYAKRIKRLHHSLLKKLGKPAASEPIGPIEAMLIGILAVNTTTAKATAVYRKLVQRMVDLNELRVTPAIELAQLIGTGVPLAEDKARRIVSFLNDVRRRQDTLTLDFLKQRGRREVREYLESLEGVPKSAAAQVILFSLGGHAIPVDDLMLYVLRKEELVGPSATADEVQSFLERHINAAHAVEFVTLLNRFVSTRSARVPVEKLPELINPPPEPAPESKVEPKTEPKPEPKKTAKPSSKTAASKSRAATKKTTQKAAKKTAKKTTKKTVKKKAPKTTKRKAKKSTTPVRKKK